MNHTLDDFTPQLLRSNSSGYYPSSNTKPVAAQEVYDEMLQLQKEFASEIYYQRCLEKDL